MSIVLISAAISASGADKKIQVLAEPSAHLFRRGSRLRKV